VPRLLEIDPNELTNVGFIVDDEDEGHHRQR
jgi:hypothetical protein